MSVRRPRYASLFFAACLCASPSFAQRGSANTTTRPNNTPPPIVNTRPNDLSPASQQLMYSGKVMVSGPPLMDAAKVIARCNGSRNTRGGVYSAYTDLKGNFTLTFGEAQHTAQDASVDSMDPSMMNNASMQMMSCDLTASAAGYISSQMTVQFRSTLDHTEIGSLSLQPFGNSQDMGGVISVTTLGAPDNAMREYQKGLKELRDSKTEKAEKHFRKATEEYPKFAVAWEKLGQMESDLNLKDEAKASFQRAIDADPKFVTPYVHLAMSFAAESKWDEVAKLMSRAITIDQQHFPEAFFLNGVANYNLGNLPVAEKSALKAEELDKQHVNPRVYLLLAEISQREGRRDAAAEQLKKYLALDSSSKEAAVVKERLAKLEVPPSK